MNHPADPLPLLPAELLRRHSCAEPTDTRFRAVARLRQSLWREQHGYPCGRYLDANGRPRRLGSRVSYRVGRTGVNLIDPALIPLVHHEIAYREVGAVIHVERLWTNLLTPQALTFNLFGPLKQTTPLATAVMRRLVPDLVGDVKNVRFEHSPGRGHPAYTADHTAFDVLIRCTTPQGHNAFVAIEIKYSEAPAGIASPCRPRYDTLSRTANVFTDPNSPSLRHGPIEQLWREQLLLTAMLERGHYQDGRLLVIAPALNAECQAAIARYRAELISDDPAETRFQALTLEDLTTAIGNACRHDRRTRNRALSRLHPRPPRFGRELQHATRCKLNISTTNPGHNQPTRAPPNERGVRRPTLSHNDIPPRRRRGLIWLIFFLPGTAILSNAIEVYQLRHPIAPTCRPSARSATSWG